MRIGADGRLCAINPEYGFFGVAPGTSFKTNPNMMKTLMANSFYPTLPLNGARETATRDPRWEGLTDSRPAEMLAWQGKPWQPGAPTAENFLHQLVSEGREGQVHLAGLRRKHPGPEMDHCQGRRGRFGRGPGNPDWICARARSLDKDGLRMPEETLAELCSINREEWWGSLKIPELS